jgi:energy-coupling factor transporter ATP-binding protein EcfA2
MSDGEKAALYIIGRVLLAEAGVLVVDEAETHLHPLLANRLWDELEDARADVRFVYLTHDLSLALSRREATYVLSSPTHGLSVIEVDQQLPDVVAEALLGAATLSFRARRIVFAEGKGSSVDAQLYTAWFDSADTVVRSVDGCDMVMQSTSAVIRAGFTSNLVAVGIIDSDYRSEALKNALPAGVIALPVHEVESLFAVEGVVAAVCAHVRQPFDAATYASALSEAVSVSERHAIIVRRWQARMEPQLRTLLNGVGRDETVDALIASLPALFDHTGWSFNPQDMLEEEKATVEGAIPGSDIARLLALAPGKYLLPVATRMARLDKTTYKTLVIDALRQPEDPTFKALAPAIIAALTPLLPSRQAPALGLSPAPNA